MHNAEWAARGSALDAGWVACGEKSNKSFKI